MLPPPEYIVESYLVVVQLAQSGDAVRAPLLEESYVPAMKFFALVEERLVPAVRADDRATAQQLAYGELQDLYETHRSAIDEVVTEATAYNAKVEADAVDLVASRTRLLLVTLVAIVVLAVGITVYVVRQMTRPLQELTSAARLIAESSGALAVSSSDLRSVSEQLSAGAETTAVKAQMVSESAEVVNESIATMAAGTEDVARIGELVSQFRC